MQMTVGHLAMLLTLFPQDTPLKLLALDGVEELEFGAPTLSRYNAGTPHEFVGINVNVEVTDP